MKNKYLKRKMKKVIQSHIELSDESYDLLIDIAIEKEVRKNQMMSIFGCLCFSTFLAQPLGWAVVEINPLTLGFTIIFNSIF